MNKLDKDYQNLITDIITNGITKVDRTGTGTLSVFGREIRHKMSDGFPILTTKKIPFNLVKTELKWFLNGDTNIKYLIDNDCHIWDGDAYKKYSNWWNEEDSSCNLSDEESTKWLKLIDGGLQWGVLSKDEFINKIKTDDNFAEKWGGLGPIYGKQWRYWSVRNTIDVKTGEFFLGNLYVDQIENLINELKTNPDSRRLIVNAWNVGELKEMTLPPCHYGFECWTRELKIGERLNYGVDVLGYLSLLDYCLMDNSKTLLPEIMDYFNIPTRAISLRWVQRSVDTFLGLPFNIASYGLLLSLIAKEVNMMPDELIGSLGDTHIYSNHIDQVKEQLDREPYELPTLNIPENFELLTDFDLSTLLLSNYKSHKTIKGELSN